MRKLFRWFDRRVGDPAMVRSPGGRHWWLLVWTVGGALVGWGCVAAIGLLPMGHPARVIPSALLGAYIVMGSRAARRARAYRNGWVDGRTELVRSLHEGFRRKLTFNEWLDLEWERTAAVLGIKEEERTDGQVRDVDADGEGWRRRCVRRARRARVLLGRRQRSADDPAPEAAERDGGRDQGAP